MSLLATQSRAPHVAAPVIDARDPWPSPPPLDADAHRLERDRDPAHALVRAAGHATRMLPTAVHAALIDLVDDPPSAGALVLRGVPVGDLGSTPPTPQAATGRANWAASRTAAFGLLTVARQLGQPVGYAPEHGGRIVQHIVPVRTAADRQVSTSSRVELMFHTETAFHPHRPRYLLLLCLRGDPSAATNLTSIHEVLPRLDDEVVELMFQPRFRIAVDESFLDGRPNGLGPPQPLLTGTRAEPTFVFDADLMVGADPAADRVVRAVAEVIEHHHTSVVLEPGDLLVVDNHLAVHGRSPFTPRFDGTDRWLQRTFVVSDLAPSAADRTGRVITTVFGGAASTSGAPDGARLSG